VISDYLARLSDMLSFDRALSRCVVREVEDHLREAVAADPALDRLEAERRAIENFGDVRVLAAEFAAVSLARSTRKVGVAIVLAIAVVLLAMRARIAWYAILQWTMGESTREFGALVVSIDRFAFWLAVALGAAALVSIARHRVPCAFHPGYRKQLRGTFLLCGCAAGALAVSVISDGVLTALQVGTDLCAGAAIPLLSMAVEAACAGAIIVLILNAMRRASFTAALPRPPERHQLNL
jgi:hypothetical protein